MKKILGVLVGVLLLTSGASAQIKLGKLIKAGGNVVSAFALSDKDIAEISTQAIMALDAKTPIDTADYKRRMDRLMENVSIDGMLLNVQVYKSQKYNLLVLGDGSVRVYSALMDTLSDDELLAILGNRIGHVARNDSKEVLKNAYLRAAANTAVGSVSGNASSRLNDAQMQELAADLEATQYTLKQELDADEFGNEFARSHGAAPDAMYRALTKLSDIAHVQKGNASPLLKAFSANPESQQRIDRMKQK
ncbi:MAG: M48 family metalloprotease [Alistipes sp.]|nr:M48 family metalloprotease [Alistipes sp.]